MIPRHITWWSLTFEGPSTEGLFLASQYAWDANLLWNSGETYIFVSQRLESTRLVPHSHQSVHVSTSVKSRSLSVCCLWSVFFYFEAISLYHPISAYIGIPSTSLEASHIQIIVVESCSGEFQPSPTKRSSSGREGGRLSDIGPWLGCANVQRSDRAPGPGGETI